nr:hypothetical protein [Chondromyces crocatus]
MQVASEQEIDMFGEQITTGVAIVQIAQGVVDERKAKATEILAVRLGRQQSHLILGEKQLPAVGVVATEPGRVQADDVNVEGEIAHTQGHPVADVRMQRRSGKQGFSPEGTQPGTEGFPTVQKLVSVGLLVAPRQRVPPQPARPLDG